MDNRPQGIFFNLPHENAPDFVRGNINISDKGRLITWLQEQPENTVKLDCMVSQEGKGYLKLNTHAKGQNTSSTEPSNQPVTVPSSFDDMDDDLPF